VSEGAEPSVEELTDALRQAKVSEFLVQTCTLFASFAYGKLTEEALDLPDARLAIESIKALLPLVPVEAHEEVRHVLANLQLAYAETASRPE
jgi:hypothetical protein